MSPLYGLNSNRDEVKKTILIYHTFFFPLGTTIAKKKVLRLHKLKPLKGYLADVPMDLPRPDLKVNRDFCRVH